MNSFSQVSCLALSPHFQDNSLVFAGTDQGLFRSHNGGQSWKSVLPGAPAAITALCIDPSRSPALMIAGGTGGILRSQDEGDTWASVSFGTPAPTVTALAVSEQGVLFAGTAQDGIFISTDGGRTWPRWNFGLLDWRIYSLAVLPIPGETPVILAGAETGLFYSTNLGKAWREAVFPTGQGAVVAQAASKKGTALAGTETGLLYRSTDRGRTWEPVCPPFEDEIGAILLPPCDEANGEILAASGSRILLSRDNGATWSDWNPAVEIPGPVMALAAPRGFGPQAPLLVACQTGEILTVLHH